MSETSSESDGQTADTGGQTPAPLVNISDTFLSADAMDALLADVSANPPQITLPPARLSGE